MYPRLGRFEHLHHHRVRPVLNEEPELGEYCPCGGRVASSQVQPDQRKFREQHQRWSVSKLAYGGHPSVANGRAAARSFSSSSSSARIVWSRPTVVGMTCSPAHATAARAVPTACRWAPQSRCTLTCCKAAVRLPWTRPADREA